MTSRPHDNLCVLVHQEVEERNRVTVMSVTDLLAEPKEQLASWGAALFRRLMVMSTGPLSVAMEPGPYLDRLEAAGLLNISDDGDPRRARMACWPAMPILRRLNAGCGSPRPTLVVVGDRTENGEQLPFASAGGEWLFRALRKVGYDELSVYVVNARTPSGRRRTKILRSLYETFEAHKPIWLGLTIGAYECLQAAKIPSIKASGPQRFSTRNRGHGPELYAEHLKTSGLPEGPWANKKLPVYSVVDLPNLPMPYGIKTLAFFRAFGQERDVMKVPTISDTKMEEARRLYVTGVQTNLGELAKEVGVSRKKLLAISKAYDWKGEVREHQREITEAMRHATIEREVRNIISLRDKVWQASLNEVEGVIEAQKEGGYRYSANNAKALTQTALMIAESGLIERTEEDEMNGLTIHELAKKALETLNRDQ